MYILYWYKNICIYHSCMYLYAYLYACILFMFLWEKYAYIMCFYMNISPLYFCEKNVYNYLCIVLMYIHIVYIYLYKYTYIYMHILSLRIFLFFLIIWSEKAARKWDDELFVILRLKTKQKRCQKRPFPA